MPILLLVLAANFLILYFLGNALANLISTGYSNYLANPVQTALIDAYGENLATLSVIWAMDGFKAALTVGIPFVLVFYMLLAVLEDTGYLNSVAFLTDSVMHRFGLHGRAMIPIVAGAGCNVPAIMGTRVLTTMRERVIAGTLIVLVPCSARNAVIFGAVAFYAGWRSTLALYAIILVLWVVLGLALNKMLPGQTMGSGHGDVRLPPAAHGDDPQEDLVPVPGFRLHGYPLLLVGSVALGRFSRPASCWTPPTGSRRCSRAGWVCRRSPGWRWWSRFSGRSWHCSC